MANRGKKFESEFKGGLERCGCYAMRIPDKLIWAKNRLVSQETPADYVAYFSHGGKTIPIMAECKATSQNRLDFAKLQEHQRKALQDFDAFSPDTVAVVAANYYDISNLRALNRCFIIPISVWDEYADKGDRKSLPMKSCVDDDRIIECDRCKGSTYDMAAWLSTLV